MALGEGAAGAGLQIALQADRPWLLRELDDDVNLPRSSGHGVGAAARVVVGQSLIHIGRETDVELVGLRFVSPDVDKRLSPAIERSNGKTTCL